jgi:hypothetical protein
MKKKGLQEMDLIARFSGCFEKLPIVGDFQKKIY